MLGYSFCSIIYLCKCNLFSPVFLKNYTLCFTKYSESAGGPPVTQTALLNVFVFSNMKVHMCKTRIRTADMYVFQPLYFKQILKLHFYQNNVFTIKYLLLFELFYVLMGGF